MPHDVPIGNPYAALADVQDINAMGKTFAEIMSALKAIRRRNRGVTIRGPVVIARDQIVITVRKIGYENTVEVPCNIGDDPKGWITFMHQQGMDIEGIAAAMGAELIKDGFYPVGFRLLSTTHYLPNVQP